MATIYDIAREASCSSATVSRALSGDRRISERTRIRVHEAARRLDYRSNPIARALSRGHSQTIGLVLPKLDTQVFSAGASLLHDLLSKAGYRIILCCHGEDPAAEAEALQSLVEFNVDGIIHVPCTKDGSAKALKSRHAIPIIELIRRSESSDVDAVAADREQGSFELTKHLLELGHRRIALFSRRDQRGDAEMMMDGFHRALRDFQLDPLTCAVKEISESQSATSALEELLSSGQTHTAVIAANTELSHSLLRAVLEHKISTPKDLSIAGFTNADWCEISNPALTAYEIPLHEIGLLAAQMLLNRLEPRVDRNLSHSAIRCAGRLVVRDSTGPPRKRTKL